MKLVIDIPEETFESVKRYYEQNKDCYVIWAYVANGTPLPKGHGDLVDFDGLCKEYWDGNYMEIHKDDLSNIKPIIEADKEG